MTGGLTGVANDHFQSAWVKITDYLQSGKARQFGPIQAISTGIDIPFFNRIFVLESPPPDDFAAAVDWMQERGDPFWVTTTEGSAKSLATFEDNNDFVETESGPQPGMVKESLREIPRNESAADISRVTDLDELDGVVPLFAEVFELPRDVARQMHPDSFVTEGEIEYFGGYVDDQLAASGMLVLDNDIAGVYSIGVKEEFRRRGIGETLTWEILRAGRNAGCQRSVLQSSEMGVPLYEKMGYETVETYHHFESA